MRNEAAPALHEAGFFRRQTTVRSLGELLVGVGVSDHLDGRETFSARLGVARAADVGICVRTVAEAVAC